MSSNSIEALIAGWQADDERSEIVVHVERVPSRPAHHADPSEPLPPSLTARLGDDGIAQLYTHQAAAVDAVASGHHTVVVAGTASGKSLAYQVPIAAAVERDRATTALALYPTKALAQDQLAGFGRVGGTDTVAAVYDGDTPKDDRRWVRRNANVVLTNPDMLHIGILPHHDRWAHFFSHLKFVVVDEIHSFKGIFGSHVALVLRRLRRVAMHHGAEPIFVFTSATIGNPGELAAALSGLDVTVVDDDGAPQGEKFHVLWNPELEDPERGIRASPLTEATRVFSDLVGNDMHSIVFSRSRKSSELIYRWARDRLDEDRRRRIAPYRAGYLPAERRKIEARLFSGDLLGVAATNALELGIDVGGLDAAVLTTFPGTISSFRQQAGRSGRRQNASLAVLVAGQDALDQYYMNHPGELFSRSAEAAVVNPTNPSILESQVCCAAHEVPLVPEDGAVLGPEFEDHVAGLVAEGKLGLRDGRLFWAGGGSPARGINIRSAAGQPYQIVERKGNLLGTVDEGRAFSQCHPGAVYLHQGDAYVVEELRLDDREVLVAHREAGYYTQPKVDKDLRIESTADSRMLGEVTVTHGVVEVITQVLGYKRKSIATGEILETLPLDLPQRSFTTQAVWFEIPHSVIDAAGVGPKDLPGTLHAVEHTAIAMLPIYAICDRWDVGGLSTAFHPQLGLPCWFIYDGYPGGAGISPIAYERVERHLHATLRALEECPCASGCPSCVQSPKCGNFNEPLDKSGAIALLRTLPV